MKKILLILCFSIYLIGCSKNEDLGNIKTSNSNGHKSSIVSASSVDIDSYPCGRLGLSGILRHHTFFNTAHRKYLAAEVDPPSEGPWEWSKVLLKGWEDTFKWSYYQFWSSTLNEQTKGPNGGFLFTFKIGKNYSHPEFIMTYYPPSGEMVLLKSPPTHYQTEFEFVVIECKKDSIYFSAINSRGYLIDPKTNRMIKAGPQQGVGRILAKLGIDYKNLKYLPEGERDEYSWESSISTYH